MHPFTFAAVARMLLCVMAGQGLATVRVSRPWVATALAGVVALLEVAGPGVRVRGVPPGLPPVYQLLAGLPDGPVLEVPLEEREVMIWAARDPRAFVNGSGGVAPRRHSLLEQSLRRHWLRALVPRTHRRRQAEDPRAVLAPDEVDLDASPPVDLMRQLGVRYLIVPAGRVPKLRPLAEALEGSRVFLPRATASDGDVLYEMSASAP
jgi:hypothetical protein